MTSWMGDNYIKSSSMVPIDEAPTDGHKIIVYCPEYHGLPEMVVFCRYHPDGGFCVDELRTPTHWMPIPK